MLRVPAYARQECNMGLVVAVNSVMHACMLQLQSVSMLIP